MKNKKEKEIKIFVRINKSLVKREEFFGIDLRKILNSPVWEKKNLGKTYRWFIFWEKFFQKSFKAFKKTVVVAGKFSYYSIVFSVAASLVFSLIPGVLSAPHSVSVDFKWDWDQGALDNVITDGIQDSIQLEPEGSWGAKTWAPTPEAVGPGSNSTMVGKYLYAIRGHSSEDFWRFDTEENTWEILDNLPRHAYYGAGLCYIEDENAIFVIFGGYLKEFYKYDLETEEWEQLYDLPEAPYAGATIETDGEDIFYTIGNGATDFYKYDIDSEGNPWEILPSVPATVSTGSSLVYGNDGYMYLVRGGGNTNFYRYKISSPSSWTSMANISVSGTNYGISGEQQGVYWTDGTIKYLYFLRSNTTNTFLRYQITCNDGTDGDCAGQKDTWSLEENAPITTNYASLAFNEEDGYFYAIRGSSYYHDLWKFDPDGSAGNKWVGPNWVQDSTGTSRGMGTGGDLIWNGNYGGNNYIYAISAGNTVYVNRYDVSTNAWITMNPITAAPNADVNGTFNKDDGYLYFPRGNSSNTIYVFDGTNWATHNPSGLGNISNGGSMVYISSTEKVYVIRGGASSGFYECTDSLSSCTALSSLIVDGVTYYPNVGARMTSTGTYGSGTDIYATVGDGETAFLKYSGGSWSKMASTPFPQYYGTTLTNYNGKIYAFAGYYKDEFWEYDPSIGALGTWRKLPSNQKYTYGRGPYNGADIEYAGGQSLYATIGLGLPDMFAYTINDNNFPSSGTYISEAIDLSNADSFTSFSVEDSTPENTDISYECRTSNDGESWDGDDWETIEITDGSGSIPSDPERYIQIKITLTSSDGENTPSVGSFTISYNMDDDPPTNPTIINAFSDESGEIGLTDGGPYEYAHPYFYWEGASHNGSGIAGYYVCFATDTDCDNPEEDGSFQTANYYEVNEELKSEAYHLKIKTEDNNGNISDETLDAFSYIYSGVSVQAEEEPLNITKTTEADFNSGSLEDVNVYDNEGSGSMRLGSVDGFWNQSRLSLASGAINRGGNLSLGECKTTGENSLNGNHCLYTFAGNNNSGFYRYEIETDTWTAMTSAPSNTYYGAYVVEGPNNTLYATRGYGNASPTNYAAFWSYEITTDTWTILQDAPKNFAAGASMSYDGSRYIYAFPGADNAFYRYDTQTGNWSALTNTNLGNPNGATNGQYIYEGSDSTYDGRNNIYVIQGNYLSYFSKYSIATVPAHNETAGTWTPLNPAPIGFYYSGSLTYDSDTNAIYAIAGNSATSRNSRQYFIKYDIENDEWSFLADAPVVLSGYGGSLNNYDGKIYLTRGAGTTNFYRYDIEENSWETPNRGFFGNAIPTGNVSGVNSYLGYGTTNNSAGAYVTKGEEDELYVIRGNRDSNFGKYNVSTGTFSELAELPVGAYNGGSIVYDEDEDDVYYIPGYVRSSRSGSNNYFFKYNIADNEWEEITSRPGAQVNYGASMVYDGDRYIYLTQGGNGTQWWRYDTCNNQTSCTPGWSSNLNSPAATNWMQGNGSRMVYKDGIIYSTRGGGNSTTGRYFFSCDTSNLPSSCWTQLADLPSGVVMSQGGSIVDGEDGYIYAVLGNNTDGYYRYNISNNEWEQVSNIPAQISYGGTGVDQGSRIWTTAGVGTNSYNDGLYSYIIGSSSNGTGFEKTGSYTSETMNLSSVYNWANLTVDYTLPDESSTAIIIETRTSEDEEIWSDWEAATNNHQIGSVHKLKIESPVNQYIQVRFRFTSSDQIYSPQVDSFSVYYYQDVETPNNPTSITAYDQEAEGSREEIENPTGESWFNYTQPYFEWPVEGTEGGASDNPNPGGSGISGYYVCFDVGEDCDDAFTDGTFQTENNFTAPLLAVNSTDYSNSGKTYNLLIRAVDNANLIDDENFQAFVYKFDNHPPTNPSSIEVTPSGYTSIDNFEFIWEGDAADPETGSQVAKLQYQTGDEDPDDPEAWHDLESSAVSLTLPLYEGEELIHGGAYQSAKNTFYLRVVDNAKNVSSYLSQDFYFSASAPTPPQNLRVEPEGIVEENEFTFFWERPASYTGDPSKIKYYYSINALPNAHNVIETSATSAGPGPFATQYESNRFYIVAKDESGNIDYDLYNHVDFIARTTAPGPPLNAQVFDTSNRETEEYSVAVKWSRPTSYDEGNFSGYAILRSEDGENFEEIATTTGLAFVDVGLESKLYYYQVESKDKTNNYSIPSSTVSLIPTGRYTSPPTITSNPKITVQAYAATITWSTNRVASSFIEFGKTMDVNETNGQVDSVTDHEVELTGLDAGSKYYYRVKFIDPDGNIGTSEINNFKTLDEPTISDVTTSDIGLNSVTISWETNASSKCTLKYGKGSLSSSIKESTYSTTHIEKISDLDSNTEYAFQIEAIDEDLNEFSSDEYSFNTLEQPTVSDLTVDNKENVDLPTVIINYKTSHLATTLVKFKGENESSYHNYLVNEKTQEHQAEIQGLDPAVKYEIIATGVDENGIEALSQTMEITTLTDSRPPSILINRAAGRVVSRGKDSSANLYVKIETDEPSKTQIFFGKGIILSNFEQNTAEDGANTYHLITIPVDPGQVYSYIIKAKDEAGNETTTKPVIIVVEASKENATEIVVDTFSNKFGWLRKLWTQ